MAYKGRAADIRAVGRSCGLVEGALQLNPNHPGWFWFPLAMNAYRKRDYQSALGYALKINLPNFLWTPTLLAIIYAQLGQQEEAAKAVQELLQLNPQAPRSYPARGSPGTILS